MRKLMNNGWQILKTRSSVDIRQNLPQNWPFRWRLERISIGCKTAITVHMTESKRNPTEMDGKAPKSVSVGNCLTETNGRISERRKHIGSTTETTEAPRMYIGRLTALGSWVTSAPRIYNWHGGSKTALYSLLATGERCCYYLDRDTNNGAS